MASSRGSCVPCEPDQIPAFASRARRRPMYSSRQVVCSRSRAGKCSSTVESMIQVTFREGLEAILVLVAITAGLVRGDKSYWRPISVGSGAALVSTVASWFVVVAIISAVSAPALDVQAATGLLAIEVLNTALVAVSWLGPSRPGNLSPTSRSPAFLIARRCRGRMVISGCIRVCARPSRSSRPCSRRRPNRWSSCLMRGSLPGRREPVRRYRGVRGGRA